MRIGKWGSFHKILNNKNIIPNFLMHSKEFHPFTIIPYDHSYNTLKQNQKEKIKEWQQIYVSYHPSSGLSHVMAFYVGVSWGIKVTLLPMVENILYLLINWHRYYINHSLEMSEGSGSCSLKLYEKRNIRIRLRISK